MRRTWFDRDCEEILRRAGQLARRLGHSFVGSEHILLSLCAHGQSAAAQALAKREITYTRMFSLLERMRGQGGRDLLLPQGLSQGAKDVVRTAMSSVRKNEVVHPEQLLQAIAVNSSTTAALLLVSCGVCTEQICTEANTACKLSQEKKGGTMRLLEQFGVDMVEKAGRSGPVIGRCEEIDTMIEVLCRKNKNNPALVGDPGVGKTAIVEGLAQRMAAGQVPPQLRSKTLISLDMASIVAGTKYRGEFEERMRDILAEIQRSGDVIVFVDEMHTLVGAGAAEGAIDASNLMKPALSRGGIQMIGATTMEEYRKFIEKDAALERRFRRIHVKEPAERETLEILRGLRPGLEHHHGLRIEDEALEAAVKLSQRYLSDYYLPDKALDLLDEGAAHACLCALRNESTKERTKRKQLDEALRVAIAQEDFEKALRLQAKLRALHEEGRDDAHRVHAADVAYAVSVRTGIPVGELDASQRESLQQLEKTLEERVVGQKEAVHLVAQAVQRGRTGLSGKNRPTASILLTGPTGVGKTELCKAAACCVFGSEKAIIRLDMTEYMEKHSVSRLLGAPPGYVGHEDGGTLTEKVRRNPYSLVLFDEIDKAHPDVAGILLQIMDDGILTDSMGKTVDFSNTLLFMTANIGGEEAKRGGLGFAPSGAKDRVQTLLKQHFSAEFLGRLDAMAVFETLKEKDLILIARQQLTALSHRALERGVTLTFDEAAQELLARQCGEEGGARALRHLIQQQAEAPLAQLLLEEPNCKAYSLTAENGGIAVKAAE